MEATIQSAQLCEVREIPITIGTDGACTPVHCWSCVARLFGRDTKALPALSVVPFRQGHKTDINDALAVAEAGNRPNIKVVES